MLSGSQRRNMLWGARHGSGQRGFAGKGPFNKARSARQLDYEIFQAERQEEVTRADTFTAFADRRREQWDKEKLDGPMSKL